MEEKSARARALFEAGYNCAQSVIGAFAEEMGLTLEEAVRLASGLGGGVGRLREICGAISGSALVLGQLHGYDQPGDDEKKAELYGRIQQIAGQFRREYGTILCRELLGEELAGEGYVPEKRTAEYYAKRPCGNYIAYAAGLLQRHLEEAEHADSLCDTE